LYNYNSTENIAFAVCEQVVAEKVLDKVGLGKTKGILQTPTPVRFSTWQSVVREGEEDTSIDARRGKMSTRLELGEEHPDEEFDVIFQEVMCTNVTDIF